MPKKRRICDVRLLPSGACIDHGAQVDETSLEQPHSPVEPGSDDVVITKQMAFKYRKELGAMQASWGSVQLSTPLKL